MLVARAQREARSTGKGGKWRPPASEWNSLAELMAAMLDRQGEMVALLASMPVAQDKKGKPVKRQKPPKPYPRPETAIERADRELVQQHVDSIIADVEASYVSVDEYAATAAEVERYRQAQSGSDVG